MRQFVRPIFALSFAAFMVASASLSSDAAPAARQGSANFDGLWSVVIVTLQGSCDRFIGIHCASWVAGSCRPMPTQAIACTVL
jgi:hypothetical protein